MLSIPEAEGHNYTLAPIAAYLEQIEQRLEQKLLGEKACLKRNQGMERPGFGMEPFLRTSDPWYVNRDESFIATPYTGTLQSVTDMIYHIRHYQQVVVQGFTQYIFIPFSFTGRADELCKGLKPHGWEVETLQNSTCFNVAVNEFRCGTTALHCLRMDKQDDRAQAGLFPEKLSMQIILTAYRSGVLCVVC